MPSHNPVDFQKDDLQSEIITEESKFFELQGIWNPLLQESSANTIFLTFEWLATWWRHFHHGNRLFIIVVKSGGRIVGLAPFVIKIQEGFRRLSPIGGRTADYADFIIAKDQNREAVLERIFDIALQEKSWDIGRLDGLPEDSPNLTSLKAVLSRRSYFRPTWRQYDNAPYILIDQNWESYWESLRQSPKKNSKQMLRMLTREKGGGIYHEPKDLAEVDFYIEELVRQHLVRRKEVTRTLSVFENKMMIEFYKDIARQLFTLGWLRMPILLVQGEVGAISLDFEYAAKYFYYMPTFNPTFGRYSIGRMLLLNNIKSAFDRGLKEFDFMLGNEPYKLDYNPKIRKLYKVTWCQPGIRGYVANTWFNQIRPRFEALVDKYAFIEQVKWLVRRKGLKKG